MWQAKEVVCEREINGMLQEAVFVNVIPLFGKEHLPHPDCWCHPEYGQGIIIHNIQH